MTDSNLPILVTGAAGKTGRAVIRALAGRGAPVRALVRPAARGDARRDLGVREAIEGDMRDPSIWPAALAGVRAVYHICPNVSPDEITIGASLLRAAGEAALPHVVYHSVLHPQTEDMPHHWQKLRVEERLLQSGLPFTILQPASYMQNLLAAWPAIRDEGVYRVPYGLATRLSMVDLEDVAEAAAIVLTEPGHTGASYELCGPEVLTQTDVAGVLAEVLGRPVRAETISLEAWEQQAGGLSAYAREALLAMFRYYDRYGFYGSPRVLGWLLGRPPSSLAAFGRKQAG